MYGSCTAHAQARKKVLGLHNAGTNLFFILDNLGAGNSFYLSYINSILEISFCDSNVSKILLCKP